MGDIMNTPYFHLLEQVEILDPISPYYGKYGVIDWVYPQDVRVSIWTGTYPPQKVIFPKTAIAHRKKLPNVRVELTDSLQFVSKIYCSL